VDVESGAQEVKSSLLTRRRLERNGSGARNGFREEETEGRSHAATVVHAGGTFHHARSRKLPSLTCPNCTQGQAHLAVDAWLLGCLAAWHVIG
jgi:hypothetical protein